MCINEIRIQLLLLIALLQICKLNTNKTININNMWQMAAYCWLLRHRFLWVLHGYPTTIMYHVGNTAFLLELLQHSVHMVCHDIIFPSHQHIIYVLSLLLLLSSDKLNCTTEHQRVKNTKLTSVAEMVWRFLIMRQSSRYSKTHVLTFKNIIKMKRLVLKRKYLF